MACQQGALKIDKYEAEQKVVKMRRFEIEEAVKDIKRIMQMIGTWPEESPSTTYRVTGFVTMAIKSVLVITTLIQVCKNFADLQSVSFGICASLAAFHSVVKHLIVLYNKPKFFTILNRVMDPILALHEGHLYIYLERKIRLCNLFRLIFFISGLGTGVMVIVSPIFDTKSERPLPMPFPMNMNEQHLATYYFIWGFQSVGILLTCWNIPCLDGLIFTFMAIAAGQLRILREKIIHSVDWSPSEFGFSQIIRQKQVSATNMILKECVRQHLAIERYIATIEETFTVGFLLQLIISVIITCLIGFNFILLPVTSLDFGRCLLFFSAVIIELIFFCVPGNEIILQSQKIREACYMSEWTHCDPSVRKTLFIIMERSKKPFALTAAKFAQLSLGTFVGVLKSAFSYFSVILQLYADSRKV